MIRFVTIRSHLLPLPAVRLITVLIALCLTIHSAETLPRKAPEFMFNFPGIGDKLLSQYQGKVVALEFIETTCPHCQAASKFMSELQAQYGSRGLQVVSIAVNSNADLLVENFAREFHVNFPVGWSTPDRMRAFMGFDPGLFVVPQLALIDRKGYIHYQTPAKESEDWEKLMNHDSLRFHIEELVRK